MPGRHDSFAPRRAGWVPTALRVAVAGTPATAFLAALGLAGGGFLSGRAGVASCGAVVGAVGVAAERFSAREVRRRLRRERAAGRDALREVSRDVQELRQELAALRDDLHGARADRDAVAEQLHSTRAGLATPSDAAEVRDDDAEVRGDDAEVPSSSDSADVAAETPGPAPIKPFVPGQLRSPLATGGIPVLPPGPSEPVVRPSAAALAVDEVDALVWAAIADDEADELTRVLQAPGRRAGRHAGMLHAGDAHHAGDYARDDTSGDGTAVILVVSRGRHAA